jgi:peptidoglycan-N-acetylglucosamine deacetylase
MSRTCSHNKRTWVPAPAVYLSIWFHAVLVLAVAAAPTLWSWLLGALVLNHLLLTGFGMWPKSTLLGPNLSRLSEPCHRRAFVALTFDDGPDPEVTPRILDLLDQHDAKASFFCIGRRAAAFPHIVREIIRRGHSVENHSNNHSLGFAFYSVRALRREIYRSQATLSQTSGTTPQYFRAPVGLRSPLLDPVVAEVPLCYVSWTRRGYDRVSRHPQKVLRRLTRGLAAGDILLLHDTGESRTAVGTPVVLDVLPRLLELLEASGLRAVSLPLALAEQSRPWARS